MTHKFTRLQYTLLIPHVNLWIYHACFPNPFPYQVVTPVAVEILYLSPSIEEIYRVLQILYLYSSFYALFVVCYNKVHIKAVLFK